MKSNVFWGLLAGILVLWLLAFYFLAWGKKAAFDEVNARLNTNQLKLKRYAETAPDEFPRAALEERRQAEAQRLQQSYASALAVLNERDRQFEVWLTGGARPSLVEWQAAYRDAFQRLADEYRAHAGLGPDAVLPFRASETFNSEADLPLYEKRWKAQAAIVRAVIATSGAQLEELVVDDRPRDLGPRMADNRYFDRSRWTASLLCAPASVGLLVERLLVDPVVCFEVQQSQIAKKREHLQADLLAIQNSGVSPPAEPPVRVRLVVNVLDWKYVEPQESED